MLLLGIGFHFGFQHHLSDTSHQEQMAKVKTLRKVQPGWERAAVGHRVHLPGDHDSYRSDVDGAQ